MSVDWENTNYTTNQNSYWNFIKYLLILEITAPFSCIWIIADCYAGFPSGLWWESTCNVEDVREMAWISGLWRSAEGGNGNPLQYSCWENPVDKGAWWATVHGGHKESDTTEHCIHLWGLHTVDAWSFITEHTPGHQASFPHLWDRWES